MSIRKEYEDLTFTDDFMFCKILTKRKDLCKELLEMILQIRIERIEVSASQYSIDHTYDGRGIRLDVYAMDEKGTVYDIEMQTTKKKDLPKRMRYYQGMIDLDLIDRGAHFSELKQTYIIFICTDDAFDKGLPIYSFRSVCKELPELILEDMAEKIVINAKGKSDNISEEMRAFLSFIDKSTTDSFFTKELKNAVDDAIAHDEWRGEYMTFRMKLNEEHEEGREEGRVEGRAEGRVEGRLNSLTDMIINGGTDDDLRRLLRATDEEIRQAHEKAERSLVTA